VKKVRKKDRDRKESLRGLLVKNSRGSKRTPIGRATLRNYEKTGKEHYGATSLFPYRPRRGRVPPDMVRRMSWGTEYHWGSNKSMDSLAFLDLVGPVRGRKNRYAIVNQMWQPCDGVGQLKSEPTLVAKGTHTSSGNPGTGMGKFSEGSKPMGEGLFLKLAGEEEGQHPSIARMIPRCKESLLDDLRQVEHRAEGGIG